MLGIGVGAMLAGLPGFVRSPKTRRIMWASTLAAGFGVTIGGAVATVMANRRITQRVFDGHWSDGSIPPTNYWPTDDPPCEIGAPGCPLQDELDLEVVSADAKKHTISTTFVGLGVGLAVTSIVGLVVDATAPQHPRPERQVRLDVSSDGTQYGVRLSGHF